MPRGFRSALLSGGLTALLPSGCLKGRLTGLSAMVPMTSRLTLLRVPGAFEIPLAAQKMAARRKYDAIICLGAVIRGATPHFDYVAGEVSKGVASVSLESGIPVIFGILTTDTIEQAVERAGTKAGNKGFDAAVTAIETANVFKELA